jgi:hypothetical protein
MAITPSFGVAHMMRAGSSEGKLGAAQPKCRCGRSVAFASKEMSRAGDSANVLRHDFTAREIQQLNEILRRVFDNLTPQA